MRLSPRAALLLVLPALFALLLIQGVCTQEDAFISFRYARNLVAGHGLVYNPGERVEGYTNFLWTLLMAGVLALGGDPVPGSRWLGVAALLLLLAVLYRRAGREGGAAAGVSAVVLAATVPGLAAEAVQGLETVPFTLLVALGVWAWQDGCHHTDRRFPPTAVLWLWLAALTRPEGLGVAGLCWLGCCVAAPRSPGRRRATAALATVLLLYLPYWIWRFHYYGDPLPNTFYAKVTGGGPAVLLNGWRYLGRFLLGQPGLTLAAAGWAWLVRRRPPAGSAGTGRAGGAGGAPVPVVLGGYALYVVLVGGDFKETFRFLLPLVPLLAAGAAVSWTRWWEAHPARRRWTGLVLLLLAAINAAPLLRTTVHWSHRRAFDLRRRVACGAWLRDHVRPDAVLAIHSAGIVPYVSGLRTIDMWGLNDRHIARTPMVDGGRGRWPGHAKQDDAYVLDRRPDIIVPFLWQMVTDRPEGNLLAACCRESPAWRERRREYRETAVPLPPDPADPDPHRWFHFLVRRDSDALLSGSPPRRTR